MNREKVIELLKNYRSYKYAVRMYEQSIGIPCATISSYSDMPRGSSFGSRMPRVNDGISIQDQIDYNGYKRATEVIDGALRTLSDDEESVIRYKWMDDMTLGAIAQRKNYSERTVKRMHKTALFKLSICFQFAEFPEIEYLPVA